MLLNFSCYTYKVFPSEYRKLENHEVKPVVFVINDSLEKEFEILKHSQIFEITGDSLKSDFKVKLHQIEQSWVCGQPLTFSMMTIGQLPVYLPDRYFFKFDEIRGDMVIKRTVELKIAKKVWFWNMLVFNKRFEEKAGKALLGDYLNKNY